jgi:choloylglycine hydrolase
VFGPFGFAPPAHLIVHDRSGASAVFEWRDGRMVVFDNPVGVATNWPHLDWHLTNLRNYVNLSVRNPSPVTIEGVELAAMGQGPGMNGLPGDFSSPARFIRATAFVSALRPVDTGAELEKSALHVLNNFDIPFGFIREDDDPANDDHTLWSTVSNLNAGRYVVRTYDNPVPQAIDLSTVDFTVDAPVQVEAPSGGFATLTIGA